MSFLFMGAQGDPEFDTIEARGGTRIYDATRAPTDAELRLNREPRPRAAPTGRPGVVVLTGGGPCVCGRCLLEPACPSFSKPTISEGGFNRGEASTNRG